MGWALAVAIITLVMVFDILTRGHDHPERGWAVPIVDEVSSSLMSAVFVAIPAAVALWVRRSRPAVWLAAPVHVLAALTNASLHVAGFVALRKLVYPAILGANYRFGPLYSEVLYEFGKDLPAYAFGVTAFWVILKWRAPSPLAQTAAPASLDIRDGARLVRALVAEILAVRSAGNYAEFFLADGRRPLMRTSLGALEARLAPLGFVRTHRSWLVNTARVTGLKPEGSGDYAVELGEVEAPLSRRFRGALAILRP